MRNFPIPACRSSSSIPFYGTLRKKKQKEVPLSRRSSAATTKTMVGEASSASATEDGDGNQRGSGGTYHQGSWAVKEVEIDKVGNAD